MAKKSCEKLSLWETQTDDTITIRDARLFEYDDYFKVKINRKLARKHNLDTNLEGWCLCASEDANEGPHHHGEVTDCKRTSTINLKFPKDGVVVLSKSGTYPPQTP